MRALTKLHTWYPGQRAEFDFTKYGIFLYPNKNWTSPVLYHDGVGCDHASGVIGSFVTTASPSSRDVVRLYKRYVMPKSTWLDEQFSGKAQHWDVFGLPHLVAIDNGSDFVSNMSTAMFLFSGTILLRIPPRRGDLKGTVERTQQTLETRYISHLPGYVQKVEMGLNPKYTKARERAQAAATMTLAEYEEKMLDFVLQYNDDPHPRLRRRRIDVYRSGMDQAPPLLLSGLVQQRLTFALTYEVKLTREGVEVEKLKFNSEALLSAYRTYSGSVVVKLDPDDVRTVLVLVPHIAEPIEANLTTFFVTEKVSMELLQLIIKEHEAEAKRSAAHSATPIPFAFAEHLLKFQESTEPTVAGTTVRKEVQGVTHAATLPPAVVRPVRSKSLDEMLKDTELDDGQ